MVRQILGYLTFLLIAYFLSENRGLLKKKWKNILFGVIFQITLAIALVNIPSFVNAMEYVANAVMKLKDATIEGTKFVFGYIGGGELPFELKEGSMAFVLAFQAFPTVIVVSILAAVLTYLKVIPFLANVIGSVFRYIFGISNNIGMVGAGKIFLGQFEAALLIKTKLNSISKSEMFVVMSMAFSTTSAALMPVYTTAIYKVCPEAMTHIIMSSIIGVISTFLVCVIMAPPSEQNIFEKQKTSEKPYPNLMTAISKGSSDGAFVWWAIVGSLIGMVALITIVNYILAAFPNIGAEPITLQRIFSFIMYPFAWIIGIPEADISNVAQIIGTKFVLNETIAYFDMVKMALSKDSITATIYAITNFGNFACIGMTVGGFIAMAPGRKDIASLGVRSFIAGTIATGLTATLMSFFIFEF
ncbi:MAG: hypothetical protein LBI26_01875 [Holosporales bacterium]|jgi:CNT family concentrative nucleoside transporter|nr:hypothetical protein [Holosporales bacterium]